MPSIFDDIAPAGPTGARAAPKGIFDDILAPGSIDQLAPKRPLQQEQEIGRRTIFRGLQDIPEGAAQLGTHGLEELTGSGVGAGTVDKYIADQEAAYNKGFPSGHAPSFDAGRAIGNMVAGAPFALAPEIFGSRLAAGALSGALSGALQPATPGADFWTQKGEQTLGGLAGGVGGSAATGAVARTIGGAANPDVKLLMSEGVRPTPGQISGGFGNAIEEKLSSIPGVGDMIANARRRAVGQFNSAATNRALGNIGESVSAAPGREAMSEMHDKISKAYDALLPKLTWQADPQFVGNMTNIVQNANLLPDKQKQLMDILRQQFGKTSQGMMSGQTFKEVDSKLGKLARDYKGAQDPDQRNLGDAFQAVQTELRSALERSNPNHAPELKSINAAYADALRVQGAAGRQGSEGGMFSPAALSGSVRQLDPTLRKGAFARGEARMQDLSDAGRAVLGNKVPDSGTPGRALMAAMALGGLGGEGHHIPIIGHYTPALAAAGAAGMGLYTAPGQTLMAHLLASRPAAAAPIASVVRRAGPLAATGVGGLLAQQFGP